MSADETCEPLSAITLSTGWEPVDDGQSPHVAAGVAAVPIVIDPNLSTLGEAGWDNGYSISGRVIRLRQWDEQVLLHEVLHCLLDELIPYEVDGLSHKVINAVEVGLTTAGWRLVAPDALDGTR